MEERLSKRVVGQDEAVRAIAKAVRRGRVGLRDPRQAHRLVPVPRPSGVGKTELGKALAEFLFDDEQALTRLDMSEFMERHMAQRLIGAPPGYADSEQGGFLTEAGAAQALQRAPLRRGREGARRRLQPAAPGARRRAPHRRPRPHGRLLEHGRDHDEQHRLASASSRRTRSCSRPRTGARPSSDVLMEELKAFFRPEFLNRIDDIVVFKALSKDDLRGIVDIQLRRLEKLLSRPRDQARAHRRREDAPRRSRVRAERSARARCA
jgi:ATP-dependent Clp protease ATP-binding subunit ClpB